jgi:hypothetical protein
MRTLKALSANSIGLVAALVLAGCGLSSDDQRELSAACEGRPVAGAGAHERGPDGFVPFKKDDADGSYAYDVDGVHYKLRRPSKLAEAHTVFCMEPVEEVPEGLCAFDTVEGVGVAGIQVMEVGRSEGPTFPRVSMQRKARLVDPSTGDTIAEHTETIEAPKCDQFVGDPTKSAFRALSPSGISFADWATGQLGVSK